MLKQSPCRNQRTRGFKVKHAIQICLLISICIWLLYQAKHSHHYYNGPEERSTRVQEGARRESIKLGRKDIYGGGHGVKEEEMGENKLEETEEEGRVTGDEEIDGHDQERGDEEEPEEVEDLIDVEDRENEQQLEGESRRSEDTTSAAATKVREISSI